MSEKLPILETSHIIGWLQKAFERWQQSYLLLATAIALVLASPVTLGALIITALYANLDSVQWPYFLRILAIFSTLSGMFVFLDIYFLTGQIRAALQKGRQINFQTKILAWEEAVLLPNRANFAIGVTLVLTYIMPLLYFMHHYGYANLDKLIYLGLGQLLAGLNLITGTNLTLKFFLMPVFNFLAPTEEDIPIEHLQSTSMQWQLFWQNVLLVLMTILLIAPGAYHDSERIIYQGAFHLYTINLIRRDLISVSLLSIALSLVYNGFMAYVFSTPARYITQTIKKIQAGKAHFRAPVIASDEIGQIAMYINRLLDREQTMQATLNQQVEERTQALTQRTAELEAIAQIAEKIAQYTNVTELVESVVEIVPKHFPYYHVGIFTVDEQSGYAVLRAANSLGGQKMLGRGHRLRIGEGIVGTVAQQHKVRIALDVGTDAVFFQNPDLPETRSEMALPMIARQKLIGVLDIQSKEANAFSYENIETLQILANQIALAIENTRLLEESQQTLKELQTTLEEQTKHEWQIRTMRKNYALTYTGLGYKAGSLASEDDDAHFMEIPIKIQNISLGKLKLHRKHQPWTKTERAMAEQVSQQIALALENARLLETTRKFVERERTFSQISARMRQSLDLEAVLRTTANELQRQLGLEKAEIRLLPPEEEEKTRG